MRRRGNAAGASPARSCTESAGLDTHGKSRRPTLSALSWLLAIAAALALLAACDPGGGESEPSGAERSGNDGCPFRGGVVRGFSTIDLAGGTGDPGPGNKRAADVAIPLVNKDGGILGCPVELDVVEEGFPDVDACLRSYREAIGEGDKYAFFFAPSTSGCMASVTELTSAAHKPLIGNQAADHRPFFGDGFQKLNFHASVSTFLEGRASARFAAKKGWKRVSVLAPNFAYGQDVAKSFTEYFTRIVPGGEIVEEQFPELDERNFTPFINALVADEPDGIFSGFFGGFVIPFWRQWQDGGHQDTPTIGGLVDMPGWELVRTRRQIPENSYAYSRGAWQLTSLTPTGKTFHDAYVRKFGTSDHPLPLAWAQAFWSGVLMLKALVEETESLDPDKWVEIVETGGFTYPSPYHVGETPVDPVNHLSDTCAQLGRVTFEESLPVPASYDLGDTQNICMHDVLDSDEARRLTPNPVSDEAITRYEANVAKVREADSKVPELGG